MLGNVLLKVSTNGKIPRVDGFSLFFNRISIYTRRFFKVMVQNFRLKTPFDESIFKIF